MKNTILTLGILISSANSASAETWYCTGDIDGIGEQTTEWHVAAKCLEETKSQLEIDYPQFSTSNGKYHCEYSILHNDKDIIIAERDYSGRNENKEIEASIDSIILNKFAKTVIYSHILTHPPDMDEIKNRSGSCKKSDN